MSVYYFLIYMERIITLLDQQTLGNVKGLDKLSEFGRIYSFPTTSDIEVADRIRNSQIVITNKVRLGREEMDAASGLKLICVAATGMNNIDLDYAAEKGIQVKNVSGYSTGSVAQHTFAMLFALLNHITQNDAYVKTGDYSQSKIFTNLDPEIEELEGKIFGIIGLGTIGRKVAEIAKAFGASVIYYSTSGKHDDPEFHRVPLEEIVSSSEILSVHAPLNDNTKNLIGIKELSVMRKDSILLNMGRGGIVNEKDLAQALDNEMIRAAGIDVFAVEPLPHDHPFLHLKNKERLLLSPHVAWAGKNSRERLVEGIIQNIRDYLNSERNIS